jgi:AraC family transcriptional regulator, transcriptional activator of pobA
MPVVKVRYRRPAQADPGLRVRPVFDDFHRLQMTGDCEYPEHQHTNYELILVEAGPYRCALNGEELQLERGQILVIKPGDRHQDHLRHGQRHYVVHFRLLPAEARTPAIDLFRADAPPAAQICRGNHLRDSRLIRELKWETETSASFAPAVQDCVLEALFWRTVRDLPVEGLSDAVRRLPQDEALRERIAGVLQRHLRANPTVCQLAAQLGMSPRQLTHLCNRLHGDSPARLLLRQKLHVAEAMLRHRGMRVQEVSNDLGFANPYHFSRVFRREWGLPPSVWARS